MPASYLLDTNTASYIIKGRPASVLERLIKVPMGLVGISAVTEAELRFGVARRPEAARLKMAVEEFLMRVDVLPWDSEAAQCYAYLRAALERNGKAMGNLDMMIAAHAQACRAVLVTSDRVFRHVPQLKTEDWAN